MKRGSYLESTAEGTFVRQIDRPINVPQEDGVSKALDVSASIDVPVIEALAATALDEAPTHSVRLSTSSLLA